MVGFIIGVLIYLVSVWGDYKYWQYAIYHPKGEEYNSKSATDSLLFIHPFIPFINTVGLILFLTGNWKRKEYRNGESFFKPKHNRWDSKERH